MTDEIDRRSTEAADRVRTMFMTDYGIKIGQRTASEIVAAVHEVNPPVGEYEVNVRGTSVALTRGQLLSVIEGTIPGA